MNEQTIPSAIDYRASYFDPPQVRWYVILLASAMAGFFFHVFAPKVLADFLSPLIYQGWALYFCNWIRRIDPNAKSLLWILCGILTGLVSSVINSELDPAPLLAWIGVSLVFLSAICFIVCTFVVRSELQRHYTKKEDFRLSLGPFMTFFFGFLYFQYHLYYIAEQRQKARMSFSTI